MSLLSFFGAKKEKGASSEDDSDSIRRRFGAFDPVTVKIILGAAASVSVLAVLFIIIFLFINALPFLTEVGAGGVLLPDWNPQGQPPPPRYGIIPLLYGTFTVTIIAMTVAVPAGLGTAVFISEYAGNRFGKIMKNAAELLAGIPSVVYGFFGLVVLAPLLRDTFPNTPGQSAFAGGLILGIMALPTVISIAEDAIENVPDEYRSASYALGADRWQTVSGVVLPAAGSGITAAIILGMGRAIGETMAVIMVTGNTPVIPEPWYDIMKTVETVTGALGIEIKEVAVGETWYHALFFLGMILFLITVCINAAASYIMKRFRAKFSADGKKKRKNVDNTVPERKTSSYRRIYIKVTDMIQHIKYSSFTGRVAGYLLTGLSILIPFASAEFPALLSIIAVTAAVVMIDSIWDKIEVRRKNAAFDKKNIRSEFRRFVFTPFLGAAATVFNIPLPLILGCVIAGIICGRIYPVISDISAAVAAVFISARILAYNFGTPVSLITVLSVISFFSVYRISAPRIRDKMMGVLIYLSASIVIIALGALITDIVIGGIGVITPEFILDINRENGTAGGILPQILGTVYLMLGTVCVALPFGLGAGIYLSEYASDNKFTAFIRSSIINLNGTPSIIFGLFGLVFFVVFLGLPLSMLACILTLSLMILPTIIITVEEALKTVPSGIREAGYALGASRWTVIRTAVLRSAKPRIVTGLILAMGRVAGETAPILFTGAVFLAPYTPYPDLFGPVQVLTYHLYILATGISGGKKYAGGTALVLMIVVMIIFGIASYLRRKYERELGRI